MNALLAIMKDTWLQSRRQVTFILLAIVVFLVAAFAVVVPGTAEVDGETRFVPLWQDPTSYFAESWEAVYAQTLVVHEGDTVEMDRIKDLWGKREQVREASKSLSEVQKSVEYIVHLAAFVIAGLSMAFFIAACSSYFPDLLESGAVDVVLSKPLTRFQIFMGKFFGGLLLSALVIAIAFLILYVGIGLRTNVWAHRLAFTFALQVFSAAVLFSFIACIGVWWRSTTLAIVLSYVAYFVIDLGLSLLIEFERVGTFDNYPTIASTIDSARFYLPNFGYIREVAVLSTMQIPTFDWVPVAVGGAWMLIALVVGYLWFRRADYS